MNSKEIQTDEIEIDLGEIIGLLLHRIWIILSAALLMATMGFIISRFMLRPTYESTTKIYILNKQDNATVTYNDVQVGTQLTKDYAELIKSRFVLEEVIQELSLTMDYEELQKKLTVSTPSDTRILAITVSDQDPVTAMDIANAIRETASIHITNVMDIEAVNIVETANIPMEKSAPNIGKWTLACGLIGAVTVCMIVFGIYILDDTIKSSEDVEKYLHLSILALIPLAENQGMATKNKIIKKYKKKEYGNPARKKDKNNEADKMQDSIAETDIHKIEV